PHHRHEPRRRRRLDGAIGRLPLSLMSRGAQMAADFEAGVQVAIESRATGAVARVTIDNATRLNILGSALMAEFIAKVTMLGQREDLRAVVLTGAGERAFIGGAAIRERGGLGVSRAPRCITAV